VARRNVDLTGAAVLAALAALAVLVTDDAAARAVPGSLLVLFVPGYALSVALLPERRRDHLERLLLALGSSISISVIGAVALNETPAGLTAGSWCVALTTVTLVTCGVGAWRRRQLSPAGESAATRATTARARRIPLVRVGLASMALALVAGALAIARLPSSNVDGFTILWAIPKDAAAGDFAVGVRSDELSTTSYLLTAVSGTNVVLRRRVTLRPGESWSTTATRKASSAQVVEVSLAKAARPQTVYRQVHLALGAFGG
jgi:hypothetical protein